MNKYKNYLIRIRDSQYGSFILARGMDMEDDPTLAIVRSSTELFDGDYSIIDKATGLFVLKDTSKKKLMERWNSRKNELKVAIALQRTKHIYIIRINELNKELAIWKQSGYKFN